MPAKREITERTQINPPTPHIPKAQISSGQKNEPISTLLHFAPLNTQSAETGFWYTCNFMPALSIARNRHHHRLHFP